MNVIPDIADAVAQKAMLTGLDVCRLYVPLIDDEEVDKRYFVDRGDQKAMDATIHRFTPVTVLVVPRSIERSIVSRRNLQADVGIDVGIVSKLEDPKDRDDIDCLVLIVDQVTEALRGRLGTNPEATWVGCKSEPFFDVQRLREHGIFFSVTTHTFRVIGAVP